VEKFQDGGAVLHGEAAHHLARVLRAETGQLYELSDGEAVWLARTQNIGRDAVEFSLVEALPVLRPPLHVTLLLSIVKFDRFEWAIEKATELGADEIVPLAAERSEKGLLAASVKRAARWQKILVESAQQSRRLRVPLLREAARPGEIFRAENSQLRILLSERAGAKPLREVLEPAVLPEPGADSTWSPPEPGAGSTWSPPEKVLRLAMAIGPEGGWTEAEFISAKQCGFAEAALGINILRTETAVCAALSAAQYAFGTFRQAANVSESPANEHAEKLKIARAGKGKGTSESSDE